jgi:hypothetical protein
MLWCGPLALIIAAPVLLLKRNMRGLPPEGVPGFDYHLDINRLGMFAPFRRRAIVIAGVSAGLSGPNTSSSRYEKGAISYAVLFPKLLERYHWAARSDFGEVCPPVPTPEQVESFSPPDTR